MTDKDISRIAVIVAHPDDEVLGFGGTIARYAAAGVTVSVLILATGLTSRGAASQDQIDLLQASSREAAQKLGVARLSFSDFPDNRMDSVPLLDVVQRIEAFLAEAEPQRVYTHHAGDLNIDHRITHQAVLAACRPLPGQGVRELLAGEINSATEWSGPAFSAFSPTEYVDISAVLDAKLAALSAYESEMRPWPHSRSIEAVRALALLRGSQVGVSAAEAFVTLRRLA
ncbi:PIG-L deacetylase family protein [Ferrovibrio sp.]|uniref:PIG-L deacetylase family protein n=1 Tax=Ferrovibrio sp. TaxID=1917215 RepID=UPI00311F5ABB